jgi:O-antigen/teichoic acid export membrane protein
LATQQQVLDPFSIDHLHTDLKARSVRGGVLTVSSQAATFVITTASAMVLARLLTPADFGLVAMVTAITGFGQAFADFGLSEATIQCREINNRQVTNLFWLNVAIGLALMLLTMALAPVLAIFYRNPQLKLIALVISVTFLICSLRVQHDALLKRQMRFAALAGRDVTSYFLGAAVAVTMAFRGWGYWALVAMPLVVNATQMLLSWVMVRWIPGLPTRVDGIRSLVGFGGNVAASYLILTVNRSVDNVLVGWYWGAAPLGLYSRAYNLLMIPVRQLSAPAGSVAIPAFSRLQDDDERFARYFLRTINLITWITAPVFAFLFVAATPVIVLLLGGQWSGAAPVFRILSISAFAQLLLEAMIWVFISRGASSELLRVLLKISPFVIAGFALGLPFGIKGVALCGSVALLTLLPYTLKVAFRGTALTLGRLAKVSALPIAIALVGLIVAEGSLHWFNPRHSSTQLLAASLSFAITYGLAAFSPVIRAEVTSLRTLLSELRVSGQTA